MNYVRDYLDETRLVQHHIKTFDDFISRGIQRIVDREPPIEYDDKKIYFRNVSVDKPQTCITPNEARKRNITYESNLLINVHVVDSNGIEKISRLPIGKIPIMLRSSYCNVNAQNALENYECGSDPGGYFIIKGKERVLIPQLRVAYNKIIATRCDTTTTSSTKYGLVCEFRSVNETGSSVLLQARVDDDKRVFFSIPYIKRLIPAGIVFRALGVDSTDELRKICWIRDDDHHHVVDQFQLYASTDDALRYVVSIVDSDCEKIETILRRDVFYHDRFNDESDVTKIYLGYVYKNALSVYAGDRSLDDKENLSLKRLDSVYSLLEFLFIGLFKQFLKTAQNHLRNKKNPDHETIIKSINVITHGFNSCFMTGNWTTQKSSSSSMSTNSFTRVGVSQVLTSQNYGSRISHLRRFMIPMGTKGKNVKARQLHPSQFSYICPYETPEGENVGLVGNLTLMTDISLHINFDEVLCVIRRFDSFLDDYYAGEYVVMINSVIVGSTSLNYGLRFKAEFEAARRRDDIDDSVSFFRLRDVREIHIECDAGRFLRPVFDLTIANDNQFNFTKPASWTDGVRSREIVFRSPSELERSVVAMDESDLRRNKCDYMEICPAATMMGLMAAVVPFANHSQSPRIAYQSNMGKQAIGVPFESYRYHYDTSFHVLDYAQKQISRSKIVKIVKFDEMCHGAMPIVAISTHCGFNQEDSIVLNASSIQRGLFTSHAYKTIYEEERKRGNSDYETICLPKIEYRKREYNYSLLDDDGIVAMRPSLHLRAGDVIVGKTLTKLLARQGGVEKKNLQTVDNSVVVKTDEEGILDDIVDTFNGEGIRIVKIRIRVPCIPEIGDKFASSCAQKGTCGMIYRQEDLPFDKNGVSPDLIMNPHAVPSRMTINMLLEMTLNLVGCYTGTYPDATTFSRDDDIEEELTRYLKRLDWDEYSSTMYSGTTGERFKGKVFIAPAFYQRLKHLVAGKMHSRISGPIDALTHQPVAGRSRDGGLRFGEMERDCMLSHGATRILKECLFDQSDKYQTHVCEKCGIITNSRTTCGSCDDNEEEEEEGRIMTKNMPFATKLLFQELIAMGLKLKIE